MNITRHTAAKKHNNMDTLTVAKTMSKNFTLKSLDSSTTVICMLIEGDIVIVEVYVEEGTLNTVVYGVKDDVGD